MSDANLADRRTVLKAIPAAMVGGGAIAYTAGAKRDDEHGRGRGRSNVVEIVAEHGHEEGDHEFTLSTDELPAGWVTFEFDNTTGGTHFAYLAKLPQAAIDEAQAAEVSLLDHYVERVTRPFQWLMDDIDPDKEPDPDDRFSEETLFPEWFGKVLPSGGPGFTSGSRTSTTTVQLDPGEYIVECYVKNGDGEFHSYRGMVEQFTVTDDRLNARPGAAQSVSVSTDGIQAPDSMRPGQQTVAVEIQDQQLYDHDLGHDVHLIRLDEDTTTDDVNGWMNWMGPDQLVSDGSEPGTFVGGVQAILTPALLEGEGSETAYLHLDLTPGKYAWVSEVPAPADTGHLVEFSVPFGGGGEGS